MSGAHKLIYLKSTFGGTAWEGLGGVALLEEVCHWGGFWDFKWLLTFPMRYHKSFFCSKIKKWALNCCSSHTSVIDLNPLTLQSQPNTFFYKFLWSWRFTMFIEKWLRQVFSIHNKPLFSTMLCYVLSSWSISRKINCLLDQLKENTPCCLFPDQFPLCWVHPAPKL